jgi:hypothetical protein
LALTLRERSSAVCGQRHTAAAPTPLLAWLGEGDDAFDDFAVELLEIAELAGPVRGIDPPAGAAKASRTKLDHR